ncbi:MAG: polysaccharide biosynthesis C-terminal domain-containing protein [Treponema sp.]|jgi:putative MATE family efflux protein|nr:polysaccharide biosynthesis C-terminal domain-containing protein [Treponema sp.]
MLNFMSWRSKYLGPPHFYRKALGIAFPVMLQQLIMSMVSLIDNFMVATLGDISMASVNVANQINFIFIVVITCICGAGGIYIAQFNGAQDEEGMRHAYRFKVIFAIAAALLYAALCWVIPEKMFALMTMGNEAQGEIILIGSRYMRLAAFTFVPIAVSSAIGTSFRETGRPGIPLIISAAATLVNTAGNWLLIYGNLGAPRLEVSGAAIATIIARLVELALFLCYARARRAPFFVSLGKILSINKRLIREILARSGMMFVSDVTWVFSETLMIALYNGKGGAEVVAGMAAGWTIANIFFLLFNGIFTASTVIIGGALGAGKLQEARRQAEWIKSGSVMAGIVIAVLGAALATLLVPLVFARLSPAARAISLALVYIIVIYLPLWALLNTQFAISRAGGDTAMGMYADVSVNTLLFVPGAFLLAFCTDFGPILMFAILKLTDIPKYLVARHFLKKERWVRNLTKPRP